MGKLNVDNVNIVANPPDKKRFKFLNLITFSFSIEFRKFNVHTLKTVLSYFSLTNLLSYAYMDKLCEQTIPVSFYRKSYNNKSRNYKEYAFVTSFIVIFTYQF